MAGGYGVDIRDWLALSELGSQGVNQVIDKIKKNLGEESSQSVRRSMIELGVTGCLTLLVFFSLSFWLARRIFQDIISTVNNLKEYSYSLEIKDLSKPLIFSERKDELGNLEKSFIAVGDSLQKVCFMD